MQGDASPVYLFLWAAEAAVQRRKAAQASMKLRTDNGLDLPQLANPIALGEYIGQFVATTPVRHLSDDEFMHFLEVKAHLDMAPNFSVSSFTQEKVPNCTCSVSRMPKQTHMGSCFNYFASPKCLYRY